MNRMAVLQKIVSGGQTGADRAALDFAMEHGIPHGGWCPKGRLAEDGTIDPKYQLTETTTEIYEERTRQNVRDADGVVIFSISPILDGGSKLTAEFATKYRKPWIHLSWQKTNDPAVELRKFIRKHNISILNIAGSRASNEPGIYEFTRLLLSQTFGRQE